jgi:hypothetical protein
MQMRGNRGRPPSIIAQADRPHMSSPRGDFSRGGYVLHLLPDDGCLKIRIDSIKYKCNQGNWINSNSSTTSRGLIGS